MIESSSYGLHLRNRWNIELVMSALLNDDEGLKRDQGHYKLKRMICNESAVNYMEGCITTIWVEFDGSYNYYEMAGFFLIYQTSIWKESGHLFMWMMKTCLTFQKNCTYGIK